MTAEININNKNIIFNTFKKMKSRQPLKIKKQLNLIVK